MKVIRSAAVLAYQNQGGYASQAFPAVVVWYQGNQTDFTDIEFAEVSL